MQAKVGSRGADGATLRVLVGWCEVRVVEQVAHGRVGVSRTVDTLVHQVRHTFRPAPFVWEVQGPGKVAIRPHLSDDPTSWPETYLRWLSCIAHFRLAGIPRWQLAASADGCWP